MLEPGMKNNNNYLGKWEIWLASIVVANLFIRLLIYYNTSLFSFMDYRSYYGAVDYISENGNLKLASGNSLFAVSYLGYYAKYLLGNIDFFFWFQSLLGSLTTLIISLLTIRLSENVTAGIITAIILTLYTEFMVFSSVFYTPVIMLFLLAVFIYLLYYYLRTVEKRKKVIYLFLILATFLLTFFFKPELVFLPFFLLMPALVFYKNKPLFKKTLILCSVLSVGIILVLISGFYKKESDEVIANDFVFFGHTDYGGDGGEGAFIYPENKARYDQAWQEYCLINNLDKPSVKDRNRFHILEVKNFIFHHPVKWAGLQFTKFFRTFGVVPESTSFKILYTGLLKEKLWLTSIIVVIPVALIILLFIIFFDLQSLKKLGCLSSSSKLIQENHINNGILVKYKTPGTEYPRPGNKQQATSNQQQGFLFVYLTLFVYYLIATVFFGHYQERYRMPIMIVFIVPVLGCLIANFSKRQFLNVVSLSIRTGIIVLFLVVWFFQARKAISNKSRFDYAMESVKDVDSR